MPIHIEHSNKKNFKGNLIKFFDQIEDHRVESIWALLSEYINESQLTYIEATRHSPGDNFANFLRGRSRKGTSEQKHQNP